MSGEANNPPQLNLADDSTGVRVPAFACIVYVSKTAEGIRARVANFPDLEQVGANERDALGKIVPEFKKRISELMSAGEEIPWIDPPSPLQPDEQKRFLPVHL